MLRHMIHFAAHFGLLPAFALMAAVAAGDQTESLEIFEKEIRPALLEHCVRCHGEKKQQGGLRLDYREGWEQGGDSGPAINAGDSASLLLEAIRYETGGFEMPPKGKLPEKTIKSFEKWVLLGAADPRSNPIAEPTTAAPSVEEGREFWSFRPVVSPPVPKTMDQGWAANPIDQFILSKLETAGLRPTTEASKYALIRRLSFDLTGLPPTPEQIQAFCQDESPDAYEQVVDRLLDSKHFGERWARHWLDVVRYAESSGGGRTLLFPDAWRYRDYVIEAFNQDRPYNRFLQQQIAGDLLVADDWMQRRENLIATAFLLLGPTNYEMQDKDILEMDVVDEQLDTIGKAIMGMTIGCARCHDHKFDPIPTHDYYALAGILKSTNSLIHSNVSSWNTVELPLPPGQEEKLRQQEQERTRLESAHREALAAYEKAGGKTKKTIASVKANTLPGIVVDDANAERTGIWKESTSIAQYVGDHYIHDETSDKGEKRVTYRPKLPEEGRYEVLVSYSASSNRSTKVPIRVHHKNGVSTVTINQRKRPEIQGLLTSIGSFEFSAGDASLVSISTGGTEDGVVIADSVVFFQPGTIDDFKPEQTNASNRGELKRLKAGVDRLAAELKEFKGSMLERPLAMAAQDIASPEDIPIAIRGVASQHGPIASRGFLQIANWTSKPTALPTSESGRQQLANWITDPRHPLTARVMANRVWYWMLGKGIVSSVDNFGTMGEPPTHPELLDYLASRFLENEWSVKQLIREIATSKTYRMASTADGSGSLIDPENSLYWRRDRKRLRAEDIRDAILFVAGSLDESQGGSGIKPGTKIEYGYKFTSDRRSIYLPVFRNTLPEVFEVFDFADPNIQRGSRTTSTVASQALWMMNHPFVLKQSRLAAKKQLADHRSEVAQWVGQATFEVLGRPATETERTILTGLVADDTKDREEVSTSLALIYQTLFQCIDFRYLD